MRVQRLERERHLDEVGVPARSPIPFTVPCTQVAPACTAATAAAVASPKSS